VNSPPDFDAGFLSHPADVALFVWAYKKSREIVRRMESFAGELPGTHPQYSETSAAVCLTGEAPRNLKDIVYSAEDDEVIAQWIRQVVLTTFHSL